MQRKGRFSDGFFPGERRLTDVVPTSKAGNSWDVCIKHGGIYRESGDRTIEINTVYLYSSEVIFYWIVIFLAWLH